MTKDQELVSNLVNEEINKAKKVWEEAFNIYKRGFYYELDKIKKRLSQLEKQSAQSIK